MLISDYEIDDGDPEDDLYDEYDYSYGDVDMEPASDREDIRTDRKKGSWIPNAAILILIVLVCGIIAGQVLDSSSEEAEERSASGAAQTLTVSDAAQDNNTAADDSDEGSEEIDLSDIEEILSGQGFNVMFDGTIFDAAWYLEELSAAGSSDLDGTEDETEIYRHYQLYGQGEGLSAYDVSDMDTSVLAKLVAYEELRQEELDEEYGTGWTAITADICDTQEVSVWNADYVLSEEAEDALAIVLGEFEEEGYEVGFVLLDLTTGAGLSYRAGVEVYSASVIKAPYIFSLLESGIAPTQEMYLAGNQSDNDAYVSVRTTYGNDIFAQWLENTGIPQMQSQTRYITTTPLDLARMFYKGRNLLLGEEEYSEWARDTFTDSLNSAAALTIGETKNVYSKAGWISASDGYSVSSYTNAAIVDGDMPYVIAFMSNTPGWTGLVYAQDLMPLLDLIHDEMCGIAVDYDILDLEESRETSAGHSSGLIDDSRLHSDGAPDPGAEGGPDWPGESVSPDQETPDPAAASESDASAAESSTSAAESGASAAENDASAAGSGTAAAEGGTPGSESTLSGSAETDSADAGTE